MKEYDIKAEVVRTVADTISLIVQAKSEENALEVARKALNSFPDAHSEVGVRAIYIENREGLGSDLAWMEIERERDA